MSSPSRTFAARPDVTLFEGLLAARRRFGGKTVIIEDSERQSLTYDRLILGAVVLGDKLACGTVRGEAVGVLLPNVTGLVVTVFALNAHGRVSALFNFTAGPRNILSAAKTALTRHVVTSRRFVEAAKLEQIIETLDGAMLPSGERVEIIYLEDVRKRIGTTAKAQGVLRSLSPRSFHRSRGMRPARPAVVLFTSGTEGAPKGVVLSNRNLIANSDQIFAHADGKLGPDDIVLNPLPMFHSFGLTAATIMPLMNGMKVVLYPSPLHYRQIPKLIHEAGATVLFATDTFLSGYARAADDGDLGTLRFVVAGAERVKPTTRKLWDKIGTELLEGYGATECSPVIACNLPGANRHGSVGQLLPGLETRLDPVQGISEGGRLMVRGANVMSGYIYANEPGVIVPPPDGWHDTGDIVAMEDGFITIKGRAKRFAKIGGEMVSLAAVETLAADIWPDAQHVTVSMADPRKGEQLVLVTDRPDADKDALLSCARERGFPELWVPKHILVVGAIPVLGSGKVDLAATQSMVTQTRALL